jgi:hypothetical protein
MTAPRLAAQIKAIKAIPPAALGRGRRSAASLPLAICIAESCIDLRAAARFTVGMKTLTPLMLLLLGGMLVTSCSIFHNSKKAPAPAPVPPPRTSQTVVTPDSSLTASVARYNVAGRFVVLSFPVSQMPKLEQTLFLYRNGLKVAEVKVTGPQNDNNIVADLVSGDAQVGDEVRDQ